MTKRRFMRVDDALTVAHELDEETAWARDGAPPELSPAVVTWLAKLALGHPQVSAAVAAALPSSGVRWAMPWGTGSRRVASSGDVLGGTQELFGDQWEWWAAGEGGIDAPTEDAARAEVDERLIAAGYTLLGAVYRRAPAAETFTGRIARLAAEAEAERESVFTFVRRTMGP